MMNFADKMKQLRKENGNITQAQLAKKLDLSPSAVSAWERGANKPLMDVIVKMSEMFDKPITYFLDVEDVTDTVDVASLPVYGNVSCGYGAVIQETPESYEATPKDWLNGGDYFYLRAKGDSMIGARIFDGDLLLIRKQDDVENGEIAAVVVDGESMLKRVYKTDKSVILQSENSKYAPITYNPEQNKDIMIIGKLKKVILNF